MSRNSELQQQLRETSEAEIAAGLREHQLAVDRIKAGMERGAQGAASQRQRRSWIFWRLGIPGFITL